MKNFQHQNAASGRWFIFSLIEQMANIGSEVIRAISWRNKKNPEYSKLAWEKYFYAFNYAARNRLLKTK